MSAYIAKRLTGRFALPEVAFSAREAWEGETPFEP